MRVRGKSRLSARTSKRKNEADSSTTSEPQPKRMSRRNEGEQKEPSSSKTRDATVSSSVMVDKYCWLCHTEADDKICVTCRRAFHHGCLKDKKYSFSELGVCAECLAKSVNGTELSFTRFLNPDKLKRMLDVLTRRSFNKKRKKNEPFLTWAEEKRKKLFKIIDFEILLDNINHVPPYTNTAEFYGDVKFIYHNSCIAYGVTSDEAKAAENLRRDFKTELLDLEACPQCFFHMYCDESDSHDPFIRLCDFPHTIVWAQVKRYSYWPAKSLKVVNGVAHVKFFGEHEQSNIPIKQCLFISKSHPKFKNSDIFNPENAGLKSKKYRKAIEELLEYIRMYKIKYGEFPFHQPNTAFKLQEKPNEVIITSAEGSLPRNVVQMKLEGINDENAETNVINAATVMEFSEENLEFPCSETNDKRSQNGQYQNPDELISSVNVDATFLAPASVDGNLNTYPVTSINMSFSSEENPSNIETNDPVLASFESLEIRDSPPRPPPSASLNNNIHLEHIEAVLTAETSKMTNSIQRSSLHNFADTLQFSGNQPELDNEVQCIGEKFIQAQEFCNPNLILPILQEIYPEMKQICHESNYFLGGLIVKLFAMCSKNSLGGLSRLCANLTKCRSALKKLEDENSKFKKEDEENKYQIQSLTVKIKELESEKKNLQNQVKQEIARGNEAAGNAKTIIDCLQSTCYKKIEESVRKTYEYMLTQKDRKIDDADKRIKQLEEEKGQLEKALEEVQRKAEEKFNKNKQEFDIDNIENFKKNHFCKVCDKSAAFTCCLNTSYCSLECQEHHAEEHIPCCKKPKISTEIVQHTVCAKTISLYTEMSTINKSSNSQEISATNSMASSTHHKKTKMISASPMLPTSLDHVAASSSRPALPKNNKHKKIRKHP